VRLPLLGFGRYQAGCSMRHAISVAPERSGTGDQGRPGHTPRSVCL